MAFLDFLKPVTSKLIDSTTNLIDTVVTNKEEREQLKKSLLKLQQDHVAKLAEIAVDNTKDARNMQNTALNQTDLFSKRFSYYLASFWSMAAVAFIFFSAFATTMNEKVVDTVIGFVLGTIVATIINFYYGSSHSYTPTDTTTKTLASK